MQVSLPQQAMWPCRLRHAELQQLGNDLGVTSFLCGELADPPERMAGWAVGVSGLLYPPLIAIVCEADQIREPLSQAIRSYL